ncbi:unnamed protein product [Effrenium voratum]|nr:unnamed protein product [Effrenium voratum]
MSLFAASLDTLKKRTTQLLDGLDKGKEGGSRSPDIQEPSVEIPYDAQVSQALGCPDDSILVRYEVQNAEDKDTELTLYSMPLSGAVSITLAMVRSSFPVPGRYHLRFKAISRGLTPVDTSRWPPFREIAQGNCSEKYGPPDQSEADVVFCLSLRAFVL